MNHGNPASETRPVLKAVAEPASPMESAFQSLTELQSETSNLIGLAESRLVTTLGPPPPTGDDKSPGPGYTCRLHEYALDAVTRQRQLNERLQELIDRVAI